MKFGTMIAVKKGSDFVSQTCAELVYMLARPKTGSHETPSRIKTHPPITLDFLKSTYNT